MAPAQARLSLPPLFCTPDESSEEEEDEEDKLEQEEDEAVGSYRLGARERDLSPGLEESGLGLLARFAASALPSPTVGPPLSVVQLEAKQKARKKEERQSLMGESRPGCHWSWEPGRGLGIRAGACRPAQGPPSCAERPSLQRGLARPLRVLPVGQFWDAEGP